MSTLIESQTRTGAYDMRYTVAIIEHDGDRILMSEGFGGQGDVRGGMYRWVHGLALCVLPGDTLTALADMGSESRDLMWHGDDPDRPLMDWSGVVIARVAQSVGL